MINTVIKKNGDREPFDEDKMKSSVIAACSDAGIEDGRCRELAVGIAEKMMNNFSGADEVTSSDIRNSIVEELEKMEPPVAEAWKKFESAKN